VAASRPLTRQAALQLRLLLWLWLPCWSFLQFTDGLVSIVQAGCRRARVDGPTATLPQPECNGARTDDGETALGHGTAQ